MHDIGTAVVLSLCILMFLTWLGIVNVLKGATRKASLRTFTMFEVEPAVKKKGCFIYIPGRQGPEILREQALWWEKTIPDHWRMICYPNPRASNIESNEIKYVMFYINPAALWWEWKKLLKTPLANKDDLAVINEAATKELNAVLTHRYRIQLED